MTIRTYAGQKAGLTRAVKTNDYLLVIAEVTRAVKEWASPEWKQRHGVNAWPDDWSRWERALHDTRPHGAPWVDLEQLPLPHSSIEYIAQELRRPDAGLTRVRETVGRALRGIR